MSNPYEVEQFIKECYETFDFAFDSFQTTDDAGNPIDISFVENDALKMDLVNEAAMELGVDVNALLCQDYDAVYRWAEVHEYASYKFDFELRKQAAFYDGSPEPRLSDIEENQDDIEPERLLATIFNIDLRELPSKRFGKNLISRLKTHLLEMDKSNPGLFHNDAEIMDLFYQTNYFCEYSSINKMVESFITMFSRAEELFFKILNDDLSKEEINEYNYIVTALQLVDRVYIRNRIYYKHVKNMKTLYLETGYTNLFSFAKQKIGYEFDPWVCKEFIKNRSLVIDFLNTYPTARRQMFYFSQQISNLYCSFYWSDAKYIKFKDSLPFYPEDDEKGYIERTSIYIPKTIEELQGDEEYAKLLYEYVKSSKVGGLSVKHIPIVTHESINLFDWFSAAKKGDSHA